MARGFGLTLEEDYGDVQDINDINLDWFQEMSEVSFELGDEPETDDGGSRSDVTAWASVAKPSGSTSGNIDLQRMTWFIRGFLDNYKHTAGSDGLHIHEFWGGENHELPSFVGMALYDDLKIALYGLLLDTLKLEVSDSAMTASEDWLYATEKAEIIAVGDEFNKPSQLTDSNIPIRTYDVQVLLNGESPGAIQTSFSMEGNNNHDQDGTIGLGSRFPQEKAQAQKRNIALTLGTTLNRNSYREILNARYGAVNINSPSECKVLTDKLTLKIRQCENPNQQMIIEFPKCTLNAEFDLKGADRIEATLNLNTLGNNEITLNDETTKVDTDIYVKLINKVPELKIEEETTP